MEITNKVDRVLGTLMIVGGLLYVSNPVASKTAIILLGVSLVLAGLSNILRTIKK